MKISSLVYLNSVKSNHNFKQIVDYGSKDKDLVYVPILFDENDTFVSLSSQEDKNSGLEQYKPKIGNLVATGGGVFAAVEVVSDAINKVVDKTTEVAKNSMEQIKSVKDTYNETFNKSAKQSDKSENDDNQTDGLDYEHVNDVDEDNYNILAYCNDDSSLHGENDTHNPYIDDEEDNNTVGCDDDDIDDFDDIGNDDSVDFSD